MVRTLEFYWDFGSPFAYIGSTQAEALAERTGATLISRPMLLGAVFKALGVPDAPILTWSESKRRHSLQHIQRWAEYYAVPFQLPSRFPIMTMKALRAYFAVPEAQRLAYREAVFRAYWSEDRDIADDKVLAELIGPGAADVLSKSSEQDIKDALRASTQRAIDAGVFGAPSWVVDGRDLYWGQDRMVLVEHALRG